MAQKSVKPRVRIDDTALRIMDEAMKLELGGVLCIPFNERGKRNTFHFYLNSTRRGLGVAGESYQMLIFKDTETEGKGYYNVEIHKRETVSLPYTVKSPDGTVAEGEVGTIFRENTIQKWFDSGLLRVDIEEHLTIVSPEEEALLDELYY